MRRRNRRHPANEPETSFKEVPPSLASRQNADAASNVAWNAERWGQEAGWLEHDRFGYEWGSRGKVHTGSSVARFFDRHLRPYLHGRYDLDILEISPGAGRVTVELIRYARSMALVDLNEVPIEICRERLKYYPTPIDFHVNDGVSLECVAGRRFDLIASYDSLVHVHPTIVEQYLVQSASLLRPQGVLWFDHCGKGANEAGRRSDVTAEMVLEWGNREGLTLIDQFFRNEQDCISIFEHR